MLAFWLYSIYTLFFVAFSSINFILLFSEYRCGFCYLELENIPAGIFNIIPSTFLPKQEGPFFLDFNSVIPIKTTQLQWWENSQKLLDFRLTKRQLFKWGHLQNDKAIRMELNLMCYRGIWCLSWCLVRIVYGWDYLNHLEVLFTRFCI